MNWLVFLITNLRGMIGWLHWYQRFQQMTEPVSLHRQKQTTTILRGRYVHVMQFLPLPHLLSQDHEIRLECRLAP